MIDLGRSALIAGVGASAGLGAAYGRRFAAAGYRVLLAGRSAEKVEAVVSEIRDRDGRAHALVGDGGIDGAQLLTRFPNARDERGEDGLLSPDAIVDAAFYIHGQPRNAWTQSLDLRPWTEAY